MPIPFFEQRYSIIFFVCSYVSRSVYFWFIIISHLFMKSRCLYFNLWLFMLNFLLMLSSFKIWNPYLITRNSYETTVYNNNYGEFTTSQTVNGYDTQNIVNDYSDYNHNNFNNYNDYEIINEHHMQSQVIFFSSKMSFSLSVRLSICLSVLMSIILSVLLSVYPSVFPSVYLSVCLSFRLYVC